MHKMVVIHYYHHGGYTLGFYINSCLDDEYESECPICAPENRKVLDIIRRQMEDRDLHEQFQSLVRQNSCSLLVSDVPFVACLLYQS